MRYLKSALLLGAVLIPVYADAAIRQAFKPGGATLIVSATTTAANAILFGAGGSLLVYNSCAVIARVDATGNTATTPAVGTPGSPGVPASTFAGLKSAPMRRRFP